MYATGIIRAVSSFGVRALETRCTGPTKIASACGIGYPSVHLAGAADARGDGIPVAPRPHGEAGPNGSGRKRLGIPWSRCPHRGPLDYDDTDQENTVITNRTL